MNEEAGYTFILCNLPMSSIFDISDSIWQICQDPNLCMSLSIPTWGWLSCTVRSVCPTCLGSWFESENLLTLFENIPCLSTQKTHFHLMMPFHSYLKTFMLYYKKFNLPSNIIWWDEAFFFLLLRLCIKCLLLILLFLPIQCKTQQLLTS
jgi:hypothetical protein